jgi:Mrp family chromosome partitioning ATPase
MIPLFMVLSAVLAAVPEPRDVGEESDAARYRARHTMLLNDPGLLTGGGAISPTQIALFATTGEVPKRVKAEVGYAGGGAQLADQVSVEYDPETFALTFTTTQADPSFAERLANSFANQTNAFIAEHQDQLYEDRLAAIIARLDRLEKQLDDITLQLGQDPRNETLIAQRDAISRRYSVAFEQNEALAESQTLLVFNTLDEAQAVPLAAGGLGAPQSRTARALLGALVGGVLGLAVTVLFGRLDRRLRTREQVEAVTGLRARVLVPEADDAVSAAAIVTPSRHDSLADSYRTLRNVLGFVTASLPPVDRARITLIVSPGASEGKTTLVCNLAAALAETGQRTIAVNSDFRRPALARRLTGKDSFVTHNADDLDRVEPRDLLQTTDIQNVSLLDLGSVGAPDELARATASLLPRLTQCADAIVIDSSPVAGAAEVLELVSSADVIVVAARLGRTGTEAAERTIETLRDLTAVPLLLVVVGVKQNRPDYYLDYGRRRKRPYAAPGMPRSQREDHAEAARTEGAASFEL